MQENSPINDKTKLSMSRRLRYLMDRTASYDTIEKVAAKSGVSFGTVRRVLNAEPTDPQISKIEAIAAVFGVSVSEFVSDFDEKTELTAEERKMIRNMRVLSSDDAAAKMRDIARLAMLTIATDRGLLIQQNQSDQSKAV